MAITDKSRKLLWGRSGNRCAICRRELIMERTAVDPESVVGDECHIESAAPGGPRYLATLSATEADDYSNLLLLCKVHHKQIDDQPESHTAESLKSLKQRHEAWVSEQLTQRGRLRRTCSAAPTHLARCLTGRSLLDIVSNAHAFECSTDEPRSADEAEFLAGVVQDFQDWGELGLTEAGDVVRASHSLTEQLQRLEDQGFWVFGAREPQVLEGGVGDPSAWHVAIIRVVRSDNPEILKFPDAQEADAAGRPQAADG